jgi:hypothetical protein
MLSQELTAGQIQQCQAVSNRVWMGLVSEVARIACKHKTQRQIKKSGGLVFVFSSHSNIKTLVLK